MNEFSTSTDTTKLAIVALRAEDGSTYSTTISNPKLDLKRSNVESFVEKLDTAYDYTHSLKSADYVRTVRTPVPEA